MRIAKLATPVLVAALTAASLLTVAAVDPLTQREFGPYLDTDMPEVCKAEMPATNEDGTKNSAYWYDNSPEAKCLHMASAMNGLDDPEVDVLIVVPASPAAERDLRIVRQSLEMWDAGIDIVAKQLGMDWFADGFNLRVSVGGVEYGATGEVNPEAFYDPEIVVIVSNPVGGIGIGIDPVDFLGDVGFGSGQVPCSPVDDPLSYEAWEGVEGFDAHHGVRSGTFVTSDCGDKVGGNVCFAVNGAVDPTPGSGPLEDFFSMYDLVSHEVGHCLTIGHVGDGAEGSWAKVPVDDIMAYDSDPVNANKCVSTLNVVGMATGLARYFDVNDDGIVGDAADLAAARPNDPITDDGRPFVVHREEDQFYASTTGWPWHCPQPDLGATPGERTDFAIEAEWTPLDADGRDTDAARFQWEVLGR